MSTVVIRADSSSTIGTGHIMRDLVLAGREFAGDRVIFAVRDLPGNINDRIREAGYETVLLHTDRIEELAELAGRERADTIVIDHYGIGWEEEKRLKELTGAKLFVLDDTYERHYCDVLLNHNVCADENRYQGLVPKDCELRCGSEYTLLREEFNNIKLNRRRIKPSCVRTLIAVGGSDPQGYNFKIIDLLKNLKYELIIITTHANKRLKELQSIVDGLSNVRLYINSKNVASIMNSCDIAIVTPSVTLNEIIYMRIPFVAIKVIDNQNDMYQFLKKKKFYTLLGNEISILPEYVDSIINNYSEQLKMIDSISARRSW